MRQREPTGPLWFGLLFTALAVVLAIYWLGG